MILIQGSSSGSRNFHSLPLRFCSWHFKEKGFRAILGVGESSLPVLLPWALLWKVNWLFTFILWKYVRPHPEKAAGRCPRARLERLQCMRSVAAHPAGCVCLRRPGGGTRNARPSFRTHAHLCDRQRTEGLFPSTARTNPPCGKQRNHLYFCPFIHLFSRQFRLSCFLIFFYFYSKLNI